MAPRSRSLTGRIRDQIGFSLVAVLVLFMLLRVFGVRSSVAGLVLSIALTLALNVGLSYIGEARARSARRRAQDGSRDPRRYDPRDDLDAPERRGGTREGRRRQGGGDIRWRDDGR
ncbi:hypothetical protein Bra3105_15525 [Brachybacterium halotolerans subsp. kimchii]|uniref:hypothetical protein n=1 Tax=Brachybacterium TaxID=43668 RepID=UPI001E5BB44D|nr:MULTISPECIES: hypothetical protein [Brachybacterium]MCG7309670.1 hypothetical protein [Brachybacterium sp. ACRRE]UEJ82232.1 hypothetical protein Bra3105_15525 [Brachybacterium halotolerans subsp. kimchii]